MSKASVIKIKEQDIILLIAVVFGSLFTMGVTLILFQMILSSVMTDVVNISTIFLSTILGFCLFPFLLLKKAYGIQFKDIGVKPLTKSSLLVWLISSTAILVCVLINGLSGDLIVLWVIQNLIVGISEEFVSRGCLFYVLRKITENKLILMFVAIFIFVFLFHSNSTLSENLIWRLPISVCLVLIYLKTESLMHVIPIHMAYNVIMSSFFMTGG